jgi:hypothetical protein
LLQKATQKKLSKARSVKRLVEMQGKSEVESSSSTFSKDQIEMMSRLLNTTEGNPFQFLEEDSTARPNTFAPALQMATHFTEQARRQLATSVGAKFAGFVLEVYRLLDGNPPLTQIPLLFSSKHTPLVERSAGDASGEWCYSCGVSDHRGSNSQTIDFG